MDFEADIHLIVRLPFSAEVDDLNPQTVVNEHGRETVKDRVAHEERADKIDDQRTGVALAAEQLAANLRASSGDVIEATVVEVRER